MSKGRHFGQAALAVVSSMVLVACSSDTPTSPTTASQSLQAAPTIGISPAGFRLCYPARWIPTSSRPFWCPSSGSLSIYHTGGGILNWTSTKSATWIKRSPRYGTAPSTMKVWVNGTGLPSGYYLGRIKVWANGATNSPLTVIVNMSG